MASRYDIALDKGPDRLVNISFRASGPKEIKTILTNLMLTTIDEVWDRDYSKATSWTLGKQQVTLEIKSEDSPNEITPDPDLDRMINSAKTKEYRERLLMPKPQPKPGHRGA